MEKERGYKVVAIVALLIAVVGIGIGFAAFSATFTINEETVTVNPSENLLEANMHYTGVINAENGGLGSGIVNFNNKGTAQDRNWSGIEIEVTKDSIMPALYAEIINESNYDAYITKISTISGEGTTGASDKIVCIAEEGTNQDLVDAYCNSNISAYIAFSKSVDNFDNADAIEFSSSTAASLDVTSGNKLAPNEKGYVIVQINVNYAHSDESIVMPDGPFKVYIPTINFDFSTAKPAQTN